MMSAVLTSTVKAKAFSSATTTRHQSSNHTQNTCYSCVDDYQIPPCTGFSKDYNCLPNLDSNQQN